MNITLTVRTTVQSTVLSTVGRPPPDPPGMVFRPEVFRILRFVYLFARLFLDSEIIGKSLENPKILMGKKIDLSINQRKSLEQLISIFENSQVDQFNEFDVKSIVPQYNKQS